jgi:hypothetical protein
MRTGLSDRPGVTDTSHAHRPSCGAVELGDGRQHAVRGGGLANLRHGAEHHGGVLTVDSGDDGTRLTWSVPLG